MSSDTLIAMHFYHRSIIQARQTLTPRWEGNQITQVAPAYPHFHIERATERPLTLNII